MAGEGLRQWPLIVKMSRSGSRTLEATSDHLPIISATARCRMRGRSARSCCSDSPPGLTSETLRECAGLETAKALPRMHGTGSRWPSRSPAIGTLGQSRPVARATAKRLP